MVWEDERNGNFEIYYTSMVGDSVMPELRLTRSDGPSTHPCVACDSANVYILWHEYDGKVYDIHYIRITGGVVAARKNITRSYIDSTCPVSVLGPEGILHIAWHEGPFKQTAVYYGKIVSDSLVEKQPICADHPEAFRPDIARDPGGNILIVWFDGFNVEARLWNGETWGDEMLVSTGKSRAWRLSVASLAGGKWVAVWFDKTESGSEVIAKLFDGEKWYGQTVISRVPIAYYPSVVALGGENAAAVWENNIRSGQQYSIEMSCYNGSAWSTPMEIYRGPHAARYPSLAPYGDELHAVYFGTKAGNNEIFHGLLRRK